MILILYFIVTVQLFLSCDSVIGLDKKVAQSEDVTMPVNNLLRILDNEDPENITKQKYLFQQVDIQNLELVNLIRNKAKTTTSPGKYEKGDNRFSDTIPRPINKPSNTNSVALVNRLQETNRLIQSPPRPSFAGQTGGNFKPQLIPPGKPLPTKTETISSTLNKPELGERFKDTPPRVQSQGFIWNSNPISPANNPSSNPVIESNYRPLETFQPPRPKPPASQQNPSYFELVDRFKETEVITIPSRPQPNRPFYAGQTGGNYKPQLIPPGKPWPARPEDYSTYSYIQPQKELTTAYSFGEPSAISPEQNGNNTELAERLKESQTNSGSNNADPTVLKPIGHLISSKPHLYDPTRPPPNRPPSAGETGGHFNPEIIPPGTPWPAKPDQKVSTVSDRSEENSATLPNKTISIEANEPTRPPPNRPPSAGETGGNFRPQIVPPGTPWPSKPNKENINNSTVNDRFDESSSISPNKSSPNDINFPTRPPPNRPPSAGETGGNFKPQIIPPGTPWPSTAENENTSGAPVGNRFDESSSISTNKSSSNEMKDHISNSIVDPTRPPPNRPPFAGETGGNFKPQIVPAGSPWPAQPVKETTTHSQVEDRFQEGSSVSPDTTSIHETQDPSRPPPNRPPFAGQTGGNFRPQLIPAGTPWPAKPDNPTIESFSPNKIEKPMQETVVISSLNIPSEQTTMVSDSTTAVLFTSRPIPTKKS